MLKASVGDHEFITKGTMTTMSTMPFL